MRLRARVKSKNTEATNFATPGKSGKQELRKAAVVFGSKKVVATTYARGVLTPGRKFRGPAIVTEYSATTVVPPGRRFGVDRAGNLVIET